MSLPDSLFHRCEIKETFVTLFIWFIAQFPVCLLISPLIPLSPFFWLSD